MSTSEPVFCSDCPLVPEGLRVKFIGSAIVTASGIEKAILGDLGREVSPVTRILVEVYESSDSSVAVGDRTEFAIGEALRENIMQKRIETCHGPTKNMVQKFFGAQGTCGIFKDS